MARSITSINEVTIQEVNGVETKVGETQFLTVRDHWNVRDYVVLITDGKQITVAADGLKRAIDNAQNAHRF